MTKPTGHERSGRAPVSDRSSLSLRVAHSRFRDTPAIRRIRRKTAQAEENFSSASCQLVSDSRSSHLFAACPLTDELSAAETSIPPHTDIVYVLQADGARKSLLTRPPAARRKHRALALLLQNRMRSCLSSFTRSLSWIIRPTRGVRKCCAPC